MMMRQFARSQFRLLTVQVPENGKRFASVLGNNMPVNGYQSNDHWGLCYRSFSVSGGNGSKGKSGGSRKFGMDDDDFENEIDEAIDDALSGADLEDDIHISDSFMEAVGISDDDVDDDDVDDDLGAEKSDEEIEESTFAASKIQRPVTRPRPSSPVFTSQSYRSGIKMPPPVSGRSRVEMTPEQIEEKVKEYNSKIPTKELIDQRKKVLSRRGSPGVGGGIPGASSGDIDCENIHEFILDELRKDEFDPTAQYITQLAAENPMYPGETYDFEDLANGLRKTKEKRLKERQRPPQKMKPVRLIQTGREIHFMNTWFLSRFVTPLGKIMPRRQTGLTTAQQRQLAKAIKRARQMGLLPFTSKYNSNLNQQATGERLPNPLIRPPRVPQQLSYRSQSKNTTSRGRTELHHANIKRTKIVPMRLPESMTSGAGSSSGTPGEPNSSS